MYEERRTRKADAVRLKWWHQRTIRDEVSSPFDADVIRPGEPGYDFLNAAMRSEGPVFGTLNYETGEIIWEDNEGEEVADDSA
jgi:hypothetical protein